MHRSDDDRRLGPARRHRSSHALVTLTVGANDLGLAAVTAACLAARRSACAAVARHRPSLGPMAVSLAAPLATIRAAAPKATVIVTGYPLLLEPAVDPSGGAERRSSPPSTRRSRASWPPAGPGFEYVDVIRRVRRSRHRKPRPVDRRAAGARRVPPEHRRPHRLRGRDPGRPVNSAGTARRPLRRRATPLATALLAALGLVLGGLAGPADAGGRRRRRPERATSPAARGGGGGGGGTTELEYAAIGDSFAAGVGARSYLESTCYTSSEGYPKLLDADANLRSWRSPHARAPPPPR